MVSPLWAAPRLAPWLAAYWQGLEEDELRLPRCSSCGHWAWYPLSSGPNCDGAHYNWERVGPLGTVFTFTRVDRPLLPGVQKPYITGLVVTDQAPDCRIATLFDEEYGALSIGARVRLCVSHEGELPFPYFKLEKNS